MSGIKLTKLGPGLTKMGSLLVLLKAAAVESAGGEAANDTAAERNSHVSAQALAEQSKAAGDVPR
jgi:hypothetical protein